MKERVFEVAQLAQIEPINELILAAFAPYVRKLRKEATSGPYPWLKNEIANQNVHVCLDGEEISGVICVTVKNSNMVIDQLGVSPTHQGSGVGAWILQQIEQVARRKGVQTLSLQTAEIMDDLLRFYTKHGFIESHRALPDHGDDAYLRVHFSKTISEGLRHAKINNPRN